MTKLLGKRPPSKLLTVGHSYVVALNTRRFPIKTDDHVRPA